MLRSQREAVQQIYEFIDLLVSILTLLKNNFTNIVLEIFESAISFSLDLKATGS